MDTIDMESRLYAKQLSHFRVSKNRYDLHRNRKILVAEID